MRTAVIIASNVLTLLATMPYIIGVIKGRQKPRVATWLVWAALAGIGSAAAFSTHQVPAAVFTLTTGLEYGIVALLGIRYGDRAFGKLDIGCLAAAALGLAVLVVVRSPVAAVALVIVTDTIGTIPTVVHSWRRPDEESWVAFALFVLAEIMTLIVASFKDFTAFAYPAFYLIEDAALLCIILLSPNKSREVIPSAANDEHANSAQAATDAGTLETGEAAGVATAQSGDLLSDGAEVSASADHSAPVLGEPIWVSGDAGASKEILVPVAGHGSEVVRGECFIGQSDLGVGRGTPITCVNGRLVIPVKTVLPAGSYMVQVRAVDAAGNWSELLPIQWNVSGENQAQPVSVS